MNILVGLDASTESTNALEFALELAEAMSGSVTAVHVVEPPVLEVLERGPVDDLSEAERRLVVDSIRNAEDRGLELLDRAVDRASERRIELEPVTLYGHAVMEIADYAEEEGVDLIVVGHKGVSPRVEQLVGSVAKGVVEFAHTSVTVVR